jgi:hypothetical protein
MTPGVLADLGIMWRMLRGQPRGGSHAERLDAFIARRRSTTTAFASVCCVVVSR